MTLRENSAPADMYRAVLDALPALVFVVDDDVRVEDYNAAASEFLGARGGTILKRRGGEVLNCIFKKHWDLDFSHGLCPECFEIELATIEQDSPS